MKTSNKQTAEAVIREIMRVAEYLAAIHGVLPEAMFIQMLAFGSALAGDTISSKPAGIAMTAKFSLLIRTPDHGLPWWIAEEWKQLTKLQDTVLKSPPNPLFGTDKPGALRRRKRVAKLLNPDSDEDPLMIDCYMEGLKRRKDFGFIHRIGNDRVKVANKPGKTFTLAAGGYRELHTVLRSRKSLCGHWALLNAGAARSHLLGWIRDRDWKTLVREAGMSDLAKLGLVIGCPATRFNPEIQTVPGLAAAQIISRLEITRFASIHYSFQPPEQALELLHQHAGQVRALVDAIPERQRAHALPDPYLAWHLSAIMAALCGEARGPEAANATYQATQIGVALASWVFHRHLYHFRQTFPADELGAFEGRDLSVLRFLTAVPSSVRQIQRRLRGVPKEICLLSLRRAVTAGLAIEEERERFVALPPPARRMSEFVAELGLTQGAEPVAAC